MKNTNTTDTNDKLVHGLLRLSTKLGWISDMVLDGDEQDWILETVDEASDDATELVLLARRSTVT
jgi:hypothetical protein